MSDEQKNNNATEVPAERIFVFEDNDIRDDIYSRVTIELSKFVETEYSAWKGAFGWHENWYPNGDGKIDDSSDGEVSAQTRLDQALIFCKEQPMKGICFFDFSMPKVKVSKSAINEVFKNLNGDESLLREVKRLAQEFPGFFLAIVTGLNEKANVDIYFGSTVYEVMTKVKNIFNAICGKTVKDNLTKGLPDLAEVSIVDNIKEAIKTYVKARTPNSKPPEQPLIDFFAWRDHLTEVEIHELDKIMPANEALEKVTAGLAGLLRMPSDAVKKLLLQHDQRKAISAGIKGMNREQCGITGILMIAWSAYRSHFNTGAGSEKFLEAIAAIAKRGEGDAEKFGRHHPVTNGDETLKDCKSAFFLVERLSKHRTEDRDQLVEVAVDPTSVTLKLAFKLDDGEVKNQKRVLNSTLSTIQKCLSDADASKTTVSALLKSAGAGLTTKAVLDHLLGTLRRKFRDGCKRSADFEIRFEENKIELRWFRENV